MADRFMRVNAGKNSNAVTQSFKAHDFPRDKYLGELRKHISDIKKVHGYVFLRSQPDTVLR